MEQSALKTVISLVDISQLVSLPQLLEHHVVEECVALFNANGTYEVIIKTTNAWLQFWAVRGRHFSVYSVLRNSEPVVTADTDAYVVAAFVSRQLPGMFCIKRKKETLLCCSLVNEEMADCIICRLHCITGCDANSGLRARHLCMKCPRVQQYVSR